MIDAHCHIDLYPDPLAEAKAAEGREDVVIAVTNLPSHYQMGVPHLRGMRRVRLALGLHPLMADKHARELPLFDRLIGAASYVGEVGLDFSPEGYRTRETQVASFAHVLGRIADRRRFVTVHSRRAESTVLEMLKAAGIEWAVFHWFSGSKRDLLATADAGHLFSVNPAMVISENGRRLIAAMPPDQVLTETDGPHVPIGGRPARPAEVATVIAHLARTWNESEDGVRARLRLNFERSLPTKGSRA